MERPDEYDDLCVTAVRGIFGRTVTYTPAGGEAVELQAYFAPRALDLSPGVTGWEDAEPRVEFRALDLEDEEITPAVGDIVSFDVRGTTRTYRVSQIVRSDVGSVELQLAGRA